MNLDKYFQEQKLYTNKRSINTTANKISWQK